MTRNPTKMKKYLLEHPVCEVCNSESSEIVHHKIPVVMGGDDEDENLLAVCDTCHNVVHRYNRSELTKIGIEKARHKTIEDILISKLDLLNTILSICEGGDSLSAADVIDLINNAPCKKVVR